MTSEQNSPPWQNPSAWLPYSVATAALSGTAADIGLSSAWAHLLERLTTNCLIDDLDVDDDGNFVAILSPDQHDGNLLKIGGSIRR